MKKVIVTMLIVLLVLSGCASTEKISEETLVLSTETASEQLEETTETWSEAENIVVEEVEETVTETETETMTVEVKNIEYEVTPIEEKSMYATSAVNVRRGPSTDFERVGALKLGQEVKVIGEASTGWYEITYGEDKAYVSNRYLQIEPVEVQPVQEAVPSSVAVPKTTNIVLIGDSRTAEMKNCVGENSCIWIAEYGEGIKWFVKDAVPAADPHITQGTKVIINPGANDPEKIDTYIYTINEVAANWAGRGATVYYATVGPCYQNPYHTNDEAVNFNAALKNGLTSVHWIDLYSHLVNNGFATREDDGFHYDVPTYAGIYSYYMSCIN